MCRCCQNCWEDFYWNCFEEKFCYDESIANYNPDDDAEYLAAKKHGGNSNDNNNLTVPSPICAQPLRHSNSGIISNAKIHEEDYRRETQTNVPMLGPEILAVFANSQIFQDHQPKLNRISTKTFLTGIHTPQVPTPPRESDQDRLIRRLEANLKEDTTDAKPPSDEVEIRAAPLEPYTPEKRITFTITSDSSPEGSQTLTPKKFDVIAEEDVDPEKTPVNYDPDEVVMRPHRLIERHPHLMPHAGIAAGSSSTPRKLRRSATSVPHFKVRSAASETDIFSISGSTGRISMTPEVPSISFSNLPKNYEDTPTIEKYRVSQSLYSIQAANAARVTQDDYSMPRYFRRSALLMTQSSEMLAGSSSTNSIMSSKDEMRRPEKEAKSKRLQMLRSNLPPLLIHSVSFRKTRDEGKLVD